MGFLSRLFGALFGRGPSGGSRYLPIYALSHRCREAVAGQIDLMNEVSLDDESNGGYFVRKVLHTSGKNRCFAEVEIEAWLDGNKRLVRHEVHGGRWLTADEYAAELERERTEAAEQAAAQQAEQEAAERKVTELPAAEAEAAAQELSSHENVQEDETR
jgi:hypothetical protein